MHSQVGRSRKLIYSDGEDDLRVQGQSLTSVRPTAPATNSVCQIYKKCEPAEHRSYGNCDGNLHFEVSILIDPNQDIEGILGAG